MCLLTVPRDPDADVRVNINGMPMSTEKCMARQSDSIQPYRPIQLLVQFASRRAIVNRFVYAQTGGGEHPGHGQRRSKRTRDAKHASVLNAAKARPASSHEASDCGPAFHSICARRPRQHMVGDKGSPRGRTKELENRMEVVSKLKAAAVAAVSLTTPVSA